jgi:prepilin-type N-terminal cleavage/methylation domain-containing protein
MVPVDFNRDPGFRNGRAGNSPGALPSAALDPESVGFTLIEVLVTSVIVAILSVVAVPVYTGYVTSQRIATLKSLAQMTAASASIYSRRTNVSPNCANTAACVPMLGIFVSNPTQFQVVVDGPSRTVTVSDLVNTSLTPQTAGF